jgi:hypothetical protein
MKQKQISQKKQKTKKKTIFWLIKHLEVCKALDLLANSIQILINYKWQN